MAEGFHYDPVTWMAMSPSRLASPYTHDQMLAVQTEIRNAMNAGRAPQPDQFASVQQQQQQQHQQQQQQTVRVPSSVDQPASSPSQQQRLASTATTTAAAAAAAAATGSGGSGGGGGGHSPKADGTVPSYPVPSSTGDRDKSSQASDASATTPAAAGASPGRNLRQGFETGNRLFVCRLGGKNKVVFFSGWAPMDYYFVWVFVVSLRDELLLLRRSAVREEDSSAVREFRRSFSVTSSCPDGI